MLTHWGTQNLVSEPTKLKVNQKDMMRVPQNAIIIDSLKESDPREQIIEK